MTYPLTLCLVTHQKNTPLHIYIDFLLSAIDGGITSVQLRDKHASPEAFHDTAIQLKRCLDIRNIPLIINDHVAIAKEIDAYGVHIGQSDMSPQQVRDILGPDKIIGLSIETPAELAHANTLNCIDYVAASAIFPTASKTNCKTYWGLDGLNTIVKQSRHPVIAIGGIDCDNVGKIAAQGTHGIAIVGALHNALDPKNTACTLLRKFYDAKNKPTATEN